MTGVVGRSSRKSDKHWRDALIIAVKRTEAETEELLADPKAPMIARAAAQCVKSACSGDPQSIQAMKELGDRIDGKAPQSMDITTRHEPLDELSDDDVAFGLAAIRAARAAIAPGKGVQRANGHSGSKKASDPLH